MAYLVEAADDMCYTIIDFEGGINLGWISESFALAKLTSLVRNQINTKKYVQLEHKSQRVSYIRALAINSLIQDAADIFLENEEDILNRTFSSSLLNKSNNKPQIEEIINLRVKNIYNSKEVIQKEIVGYQNHFKTIGCICFCRGSRF